MFTRTVVSRGGSDCAATPGAASASIASTAGPLVRAWSIMGPGCACSKLARLRAAGSLMHLSSSPQEPSMPLLRLLLALALLAPAVAAQQPPDRLETLRREVLLRPEAVPDVPRPARHRLPDAAP